MLRASFRRGLLERRLFPRSRGQRCDAVSHRCDAVSHRCDAVSHRCDAVSHRQPVPEGTYLEESPPVDGRLLSVSHHVDGHTNHRSHLGHGHPTHPTHQLRHGRATTHRRNTPTPPRNAASTTPTTTMLLAYLLICLATVDARHFCKSDEQCRPYETNTLCYTHNDWGAGQLGLPSGCLCNAYFMWTGANCQQLSAAAVATVVFLATMLPIQLVSLGLATTLAIRLQRHKSRRLFSEVMALSFIVLTDVCLIMWTSIGLANNVKVTGTPLLSTSDLIPVFHGRFSRFNTYIMTPLLLLLFGCSFLSCLYALTRSLDEQLLLENTSCCNGKMLRKCIITVLLLCSTFALVYVVMSLGEPRAFRGVSLIIVVVLWGVPYWVTTWALWRAKQRIKSNTIIEFRRGEQLRWFFRCTMSLSVVQIIVTGYIIAAVYVTPIAGPRNSSNHPLSPSRALFHVRVIVQTLAALAVSYYLNIWVTKKYEQDRVPYPKMANSLVLPNAPAKAKQQANQSPDTSTVTDDSGVNSAVFSIEFENVATVGASAAASRRTERPQRVDDVFFAATTVDDDAIGRPPFEDYLYTQPTSLCTIREDEELEPPDPLAGGDSAQVDLAVV